MEYLQGHPRQYGASSDDSTDGNDHELPHHPYRHGGSLLPSPHDMHESTTLVMTCTWPSEDPLDLMYAPSTGEVWLPHSTHCFRPAQSEMPCSITIDFGSAPQHVVQVDMTTSAQYLEVFVGHRSPHGNLRFVYGETAFGMPEQQMPGRFRVEYTCPDTQPFHSISAISFKFAEMGDDVEFALDAFRLTTQSLFHTTSSSLRPPVREVRAQSWRPPSTSASQYPQAPHHAHGAAPMASRPQHWTPPPTHHSHNSQHPPGTSPHHHSRGPPPSHHSRHHHNHHNQPSHSTRHPSRASLSHPHHLPPSQYPPSSHHHHHHQNHPPPSFDPMESSKSLPEDVYGRQSSLSTSLAHPPHPPPQHSLHRHSSRPPPTTPQPSPAAPTPPNSVEGLSAMMMVLDMQKKMLEDLETRICATVDLQLHQVLQRLDAAETIVQDLTTRVESIHQDKDIVFAGITHRLNKLDAGVSQLRSAQVQTTKAVQSAIQNAKDATAVAFPVSASDSSSLSSSSLQSVQWQQ